MACSHRLPLPSQLGLLAALGSGALLGGAYTSSTSWAWRPARCATGSAGRTWWPSRPACWPLPPSPGRASRWCSRSSAITALVVTSAIGVFHVGVEYRWWEGPQACSGNIPRGLSTEQLKKYLFGARMVRCDETVWSLWGISMAGWNAILSGGAGLRAGARPSFRLEPRSRT